MIRNAFQFAGLGYLVIVVVVALLLIWGAILWIVVATRWLRLNPAPRRKDVAPRTFDEGT